MRQDACWVARAKCLPSITASCPAIHQPREGGKARPGNARSRIMNSAATRKMNSSGNHDSPCDPRRLREPPEDEQVVENW